MSFIMQTQNLTKTYGKKDAAKDININIREGEIYGLIGRNGAGKTTIMRMISGLSNPTSGTYSLFGKTGAEMRKMMNKVGVLIEHPGLYPKRSARENLKIKCMAMGVDYKKDNYLDNLLKIVGLENVSDKKGAGEYSLGMRQRLGIALALVGEPSMIILDEPINGLDPTGIVDIREMLLRLKEQGKTIFISSHILGELEKMATRYGIISGGKLVEEISAEELAEKCGSRTVIKVSDTIKASPIILKFLEGSTDNLECEKNSIFIKAKIENIGELTNALFNAGIVVSGITTDENSAERYFINKMEG